MNTILAYLKQTLVFISACCIFASSLTVSAVNASDYQFLTQLFKQWREFEQPPLFNNAPDYRTKTFDSRLQKFELIRKKLLQIETTNWSIENKVDWHILWAELNGYEFNYKLLKP